MAGLVYALSGEGSSLVKIGWTNASAQGRIAFFQPSSPLALRAIWTRPGTLGMEQHLHGTFNERRRHNEWFDFTGEDAVALLEDAYSAFETDRRYTGRPGRHEPGKGVRLYGDDWERLFRSGESMQDIGSKYGFTREYVRQVLREMGVPTGAIRQQFREQREAARTLAKITAAMQRATERPPCRVCGAWVIRGGDDAITCSPGCAKDWVVARYHLDESFHDRHRRIVAQRVVDRPWLAKNKQQLEWALDVLSDDPSPPNRRYVTPNSRAAQALRDAGIDLPRNGKAPTFPCSVTNKDGSPCSRRVELEGGKCHIHLGLTKRAS